MTLLPVESWNVKARPDLPPYELNTVCAKPGSNETYNLENHHIWRRSFGKDFREAWWVELEDGTIVPNRVALSRAAHGAITNNEAKLSWEGGHFVWYDREPSLSEPAWVYLGPLNPQPPRVTQSWVVAMEQHAETPISKRRGWEDYPQHVPHEGEDCPTCKRRVPHKRKKTSPTSKVFATRVPLDVADSFEELLDAAAEHMGIKEKPYHRANVITAGLVLVLQAPKDALL